MCKLAYVAVVFSCIAVLALVYAQEESAGHVDRSSLDQKGPAKVPQEDTHAGEDIAPKSDKDRVAKDVDAVKKEKEVDSGMRDENLEAKPEEKERKDTKEKDRKDTKDDISTHNKKQQDEILDKAPDKEVDGASEARAPWGSNPGGKPFAGTKNKANYGEGNRDPGKNDDDHAYKKKYDTKDPAPNHYLAFTMINYGSHTTKVYAQTLVPDGVEIKSYWVAPVQSRKKRDTDDVQEDDQMASARVEIGPGDTFTSTMTYVNHPESIIDPNTKVFHKADVTIEVANGGFVGGKIYTPDYPESYPNGAQISWTLAYADGNVVRLQVDSVSTEECCDSLTIYDGSSKTSPILGAVAGNGSASQNTTYITTGPTMYVVFTSDCLVSSSGIEASYINVGPQSPATTESPATACGPVLVYDGNSGDVISPNYPSNYYNNMDCTWQVQTYYGTSVRFTFNYFIVEAGYDRLRIFDGTVQNPGNLITSATGFNYDGYQVWARSNRAFLVFTSDGSVTAGGFNISYVGEYIPQTTTVATTQIAPSCGQVLESDGNNGVVVSPHFPVNYGNNMDCTWQVQTYYGTRVLFTVNYFRTEGCCDELRFYDGTVQNPGPLLATLSGRVNSGYQVWASSYRAFLVFTSDHSVTDNGFSINYTGSYQQQTTAAPATPTAPFEEVTPTQNASCGTTYLYNYGSFASPGYYTYGYYPTNLDCYWKISVYYGYVVRFTVEYFSVEYYYDWVNIYDGYTADNASLIVQLSGYIQPYTRVATTSSRQATVWFHSDVIVNDVGFVMDFSAVYPTPDTTTTPPVEVTVASNGTCTDVTYLAGSWGDIESPNYPNDYYRGLNCEWSVQTPYGTYVQFTVVTFSLSTGDSLAIYNGNYASNSTLVDVLYYYLPYGYTVSVSSNRAFLVFNSDYAYESYGFHLRYSSETPSYMTTMSPSGTDASTVECGGEIFGNSGFITSPFYPGDYIDFLDCVWWIQVSFGNWVLFTVQDFYMEYQYDYVYIYEGSPSNGGPEIAYLTGSQNQGEQYVASNNSAYMTFHSDGSVTYRGFKITFQAVYEGYTPVSPTQGPSNGNTTGTIAYPYPTWWYGGKGEEGVKTIGVDLWKGAKNRPRERMDIRQP